MRPLLALGLAGEVHVRQAIQSLASSFGLSEENQKAQLPSGQSILVVDAFLRVAEKRPDLFDTAARTQT